MYIAMTEKKIVVIVQVRLNGRVLSIVQLNLTII